MRDPSITFYNNVSTGILRSLSQSKKYWDFFSFRASSHEYSYFAKNVFNFSSHDYWIGNKSDTPNNLSFCFKYFSVLPTAYEITSSFHNHQNALPLKWVFSGGNDGSKWLKSDDIEQKVEIGITQNFTWTSNDPFRCFQLTTIQSSRNDISNRFDVSEIDIYGSIIFDRMTCQHLFHISLRIVLFQIITLFFSS